MPKPEITAFISYSHDSEAHCELVVGFSQRLRKNGIDAILDRYVERNFPPEGWDRWMRDHIEAATYVLCVCTEIYRLRFLGRGERDRGKGVDREGRDITQKLYDEYSYNTKFIPVVFEPSDVAYIPEPLRGYSHYVLDSEAGYRALYDALLNQAHVRPSDLGPTDVTGPEDVPPLDFNERNSTRPPSSAPSGNAASGRRLGTLSHAELAQRYFRSLESWTARIEPAQLGGEGRARSLDLKKVYVGLIADPTSFDEREKARELEEVLAKSTKHYDDAWSEILRPSQSGAVQRVLSNEIPGDRKTARLASTASIKQETDTSKATAAAAIEGESLHSVVRRERCCVILGDPGSGKSVLCRWLARELSTHWPGRSQELGQARIPFLIVLRELTQRAVTAEVQSITDYLVRYSVPADLVGREEQWQQFVEQSIKHGKGFVILDGLDEVPGPWMSDVREMIGRFTHEHVVTSADRGSRPESGTGNQILVTSRITGYHQTQLPSELFSHFLIRPMSDRQIEEFCQNWCVAIDVPQLATGLLGEIFDPRRSSIHSMASNPLLLSILCQLGTKAAVSAQEVRLPQIRAELYEKAIQETAEQWRIRAFKSLGEDEPYLAKLLAGVDNVLALFAPVAGYMHANLVSNEISRPDLQEWLVKALAWFEGKADYELDPQECNRRRIFLMNALERVVGVLSERSPDRYSFLHRTFQEYLAAISLLLPPAKDHQAGSPVFGSSPQALVDRIVAAGYLWDSRWRQPLLLLCGQLAWMEACTLQGRQRIAPKLSEVIELLDVLQQQGKTGLLEEQWARLLSDVLAELPDEMFQKVDHVHGLLVRTVAYLLDAYGRLVRANRQRARQAFAEQLAAIRRRIGPDAFESVLFTVCPAAPETQRLSVAAHLMLSRGWFSQAVVDFFAQYSEHDSPRWQWAIHRLLRQAATHEPLVNVAEPTRTFSIPAEDAMRELTRYRESLPKWQRLCLERDERVRPGQPILPSQARELQQALPEAIIDRVVADPEQALLAGAIFGGFGDYDARRRAEKYDEYSVWLQFDTVIREASLDAEPWRYVPWFGADDTVYAMAVHLDEVGNRLYRVTTPPRMNPAKTALWDPVAMETAKALIVGRRISEVLAIEARRPRTDLSKLAAVCRICGAEDALRSLPALSADAAERVGWHLERIQDELSDACYRGAPALQNWLNDESGMIGAAEWHFINRTFCHAWAACGFFGPGAKAASPAPLLPHGYSDLAESWGASFRGQGDDKVYNFAVRLDEDWKVKGAQEHQALLRAIVRGANAASLRLTLPDLLSIGSGMLPVPPLSFYEAVLELSNCVAERIRGDLSEAWVAVALKELAALDPVAAGFLSLYAPGEDQPTENARNNDLTPALARWRALVVSLVLGGFDALRNVEQQTDQPEAEWLLAWDACPRPDHRLVLSRDAAALGMTNDDQVRRRVVEAISTLDPGWCIEGALLAGDLARQRGGDEGARLLHLALNCLERTGDEDWQAEIISSLEPVIASFGDAAERNRVANMRNALSPRCKAMADGRPSRWVREWVKAHWPANQQVRDALTPTVLVAAAIDERAEYLDEHTKERDFSTAALWNDLDTVIRNQAPDQVVGGLVDRLIEQAVTHSLVLSEVAASALQAAAANAELAERSGMGRLLPLLDRPAVNALPAVRQWRNRLADGAPRASHQFLEKLQVHAALWLSEVERRYATSDIASLVALAESGDDRSRARAKLALHAREIWLGGRPAPFSLATLAPHGGKATMEELGRRAHVETGMERNKVLARDALLEWAVDDRVVLDDWLEQLKAEPDNEGLLNTVFLPWRWSVDCIDRWIEWTRAVPDPKCLDKCALWLSVLCVARNDGLNAAFVPPLPDWPLEHMPGVSWLPRRSADDLVLSVLFEAARKSRGSAEIVERATDLLAREVISLRQAHSEGRKALEEAFVSLGDALTQTLAEAPETAWDKIRTYLWTGEVVEALTLWAQCSLAEWDRTRPNAPLALCTTCVSQLSVLVCVVDLWSNAFRRAATRPAPTILSPGSAAWPILLCNVIRYFPNDRIVQAAWSLLAHVAGPDLPAEDLWRALHCSIEDMPIIRDRALAVLSSKQGKSLATAISNRAIAQALDSWTSDRSGQAILAFAKMFQFLTREPSIPPDLRQAILRRSRDLATHPHSHRPLFRMVGTGGKGEAAFAIVGQGLLDDELQTMDADLLSERRSDF